MGINPTPTPILEKSSFSCPKRGSGMAELFFQLEKIPYVYDTKLLKLFRIEKQQTTEIIDQEILRSIRFDSIEISRKQALNLSKRLDRQSRIG